MRTLFYLMVLALLGCGVRHKNIDVEQLSQALDEALPKTTYTLSLQLVEAERNGKSVIHCVLKNTSAEPVTVDSSTLPWETPGLFDVNAVTSEAKVIHRDPMVSALSNPPHPVTIEVGGSLEGEFETQYLPLQSLTRSQDLLLLWKYGVSTDGSKPNLLTGTTVLKKR
jgi:hypothetical protein